MFSNMFKIAWRNALRQKQFTFLNITGLSIGITACLLVALYVSDDYKYDKFFKDADRIYRVNMPMIWGDWADEFASTGPNVAIALSQDIPEFEQVTRIHDPVADYLSVTDENGVKTEFEESRFFVADTNFFEVFSYEFVAGNPKTAFKTPGQVILTEETALRYFKGDNPLGKVISIDRGDSKGDLIVSGVIKDIPTHSHIQFDMLATMFTVPFIEARQWSWIWTTFGTYCKVKSGVDIEQLEAKIQDIPAKWGEVTANRVFEQTWEEYIGEKEWFLKLQPLNEAYINTPSTGNRFGPEANIQYIRVFISVGILILILSSVNFMNLSTARSTKRAKEVGIRKVLGSEKKQLISQFIFESILYVTVSTLLAIVFTEFSLSSFNALTGKDLSLYAELTQLSNQIVLLAFILGLGFLAGSYPAYYLSSFKPISVLKGVSLGGMKAKGVRNLLVFVQFSLSIALILCTAFVQKQLKYTANYELGFNKANVLQIANVNLLGRNADAFKNAVAGLSEIEDVSFSGLTPPFIYNDDKYKAKEPEAEIVTLKSNWVDDNYLDLLEIDLVWGRMFDKTRPNDKYAAVINESALNALGWTIEDFTSGTEVREITFPWDTEQSLEVIGIVEDFNYNSLRIEIDPLMMIREDNDRIWSFESKFLSIRIGENAVSSTAEMDDLIQRVEAEFNQFSNGKFFQYSFLDQDFERTFLNEQTMGKALNIFTLMAILIACLGLFGVASFSAEQRKKELGVRKVLGASVGRLVYNFGLEFTLLIGISVIVASPVAYLLVNNWLTDFAYKTPISIWVFILGAIAALGIGWVTIGYQSYRSATQNPVNVLRNE